jgi:hypothetical protein
VSKHLITIDRRVTLKWLAGAVAAGSLPLRGAYAAAQAQSGWPEGTPAPVTSAGYGTDPTMLEPVVPWPRTLSAPQLRNVAALCDTILPAEGAHPAPSAIGIHDFVDEWVSAPYADQQKDRAIVLAGLAWVEDTAQARHGKAYAALDEAARAAILRDAARADPRGAAFLDRMKFLTTGAYYTSAPGAEELGYVGNEPLEGDYPGPTPEALAHLDQILAGLNLTRTQGKPA